MDYMPLHKTRLGEKFLAKTIPDLVRAVERLAAVLERMAERDPATKDRE